MFTNPKCGKHVVQYTLMVAWIALLCVFFWVPSPPLVYTIPGKVLPEQVRVGDTFYVYRSFIVNRNELIRVTRQMITGDCNIHCDKINLPTTDIFLTPGTKVDNGIPYTVPIPARPGKYKLVFIMQYQDRIGKWHSAPLPELPIEVIP